VIEFSKENKKIMLSHSRIFQDEIADTKSKEKQEEKKKTAATKKQVKKIKDNVEKTTLGDIEALASLKSDMEEEEKKK
jgi:small subunit ribosomal protein S1